MRILVVFILLVFGCQNEKFAYYGEEIDNSGIITAKEAKDELSKREIAEVKIEAQIEATCKMKGCWMNVKLDDGEDVRVTFKDYGFFVPKEGVEGKQTIIEGELKREFTDVETLRHFAQDAGKSEAEIAAITDPKEEYTFVASGVIIKE